MTPEEAKTKWCPMVRMGSGGGNTANNRWEDGEILHAMHCIGPDCMAWRWIPGMQEAGFKPGGYCGAFGKDGAP